MNEEKLADLLHEARCGPVAWEGDEQLMWGVDHRAWDIATAKALFALISAEGYWIANYIDALE